MNKITLLSAALFATGIANAATPIDGWYTSVFGGYTYIPQNVSIMSLGGWFFNAPSFKNGYNAGGRVGYQSNPLRYELEYTYLSANTSGFNINYVGQTGVSGNFSANLAMANVYYDFPEMLPAIQPFLGVGIGYANLEISLVSKGPFGGFLFSANGNKFAYQGTAGLTYNFAENYALNLAYRYVGTQNITEFGQMFQAHMASVGGIYRFDKGNYK